VALEGRGQYRIFIGQVRDPAQGYVAIGRRDLATQPDPVEHVRRGDGCPTSGEAVVHDVAGIRECFDEELNEGTRVRSAMIALSTFGGNLDYVAGPSPFGLAKPRQNPGALP
jgi:hypothetical protein